MNERIICIDDKNLYLKDLTVEYDFEVSIKITNKKEEARLYILEEVPRILQILEVLGFHNTFAIE